MLQNIWVVHDERWYKWCMIIAWIFFDDDISYPSLILTFDVFIWAFNGE